MRNQLQQAELVFDALGEPVRRRILEVLRDGPLPVGELADRLPVHRPAVSKHLKVLRTAGMVAHQSVGTRNLYALAPDGLAVAQLWLVRTWDTTLAAYKAEVERSVTVTVVPNSAPSRKSPTSKRSRS